MDCNGEELDSESRDIRRNNLKTFDLISCKTNGDGKIYHESKVKKIFKKCPSVLEVRQYVGVILCGLCIWGTSWFLLKEAVLPGGYLFSMTIVIIAGYVFGHTLQRYTTLPPLVGMTLVGALYRNLGPINFLDNPTADYIDFTLRRVYPVIILTKGPLGWDWKYIKANALRVFSLATLPWVVECVCVAMFTRLFINFPWYWGLHLGSIIASVSPAVVAPTAAVLAARGLGVKRQLAQLVANAGGLDTAFTEGVFGVINSAIFYPADYDEIFHSRRVYPVIILTKGPLGWDWKYIKANALRVFSLATLPWVVECVCVAMFTRLFINFPWYWGLHLGSIIASVSPAVVAPTAAVLAARGLGVKRQLAQLVANAGGLDTAFTEGVFGVINSAIFYPAGPIYRTVNAVLAVPVGVALGVGWGMLADVVPAHTDRYAAVVRSLLLLAGGVLLMYGGGQLGWGGTSGVAVMVCAATAATRWARRGWPLNDNPVAEVYNVLWRIFEPMLFTLSGYYFDASAWGAREMGLAVACVAAALLARLVTAFLIALVTELTVKESVFIAITWIPKAIVEAVLVRVAADSLWTDSDDEDKRAARLHSNIIVISIVITSTLGSFLTTSLGPILLSQDSRVAPEGLYKTGSKAQQQSSELGRRNNFISHQDTGA